MSSKRPGTWILVCGCWGSLVPWVDVPDFTQPSAALQSRGLSLSLCHLCPLTWEPLYLAPGTRCPEGWKAWKVTRQGRRWKLVSNIPVDYHPLLQHANNLKWLMQIFPLGPVFRWGLFSMLAGLNFYSLKLAIPKLYFLVKGRWGMGVFENGEAWVPDSKWGKKSWFHGGRGEEGRAREGLGKWLCLHLGRHTDELSAF